MSEETARRLGDAKAEEAQQQKVADALKQECLDAVAAGIPAGAEKYAKAVSHAQPDITKSLGRDGVSGLRNQVASAALAEELKQSIEPSHGQTDPHAKTASARPYSAFSTALVSAGSIASSKTLATPSTSTAA